MDWYEVYELADGVVAVVDRDGGWFRSNSLLVDMGGYTLVVDTQYNEPRTRDLLAVADEHGLPDSMLIVNTHHHGDHSWGNHVIGAPSIMHDGAALMIKHLSGTPPEAYKAFFPWLDFTGSKHPRPWIIVGDKVTLQGDARTAVVRAYTPAHTIGDIVVELPEERILAAGDLVFNGITPLAIDGTVTGWLQTLEALEQAYNGWRIIPGHGPPADATVIHRLRQYFRHLVGSVKYLLDKGTPRDPLKLAEQATPGPLLDWKLPERLVLNIARLLKDLEGRPPGEPLDNLPQLAQAMQEYTRILEEQRRRGLPQPP